MDDRKLLPIISELKKRMPESGSLKITPLDDLSVDIKYYDGNNNLCGRMTISKLSRERKYNLYVDSIRYYSNEKKCNLTGTEILKWLKKVKTDKIVKKVSLEDASSFKLPGSDKAIELTRFRKFVFGQGWYESYGFIPEKDNSFYQKSFLNFQRNSINNLCILLYFILKEIVKVVNVKNESVVDRKFSSRYSIPKRAVDKTTENVNKIINTLFYRYRGPGNIHGNVISNIIDMLYSSGIESINKLMNILYKYGVSIPNETGEFYDVVGISKPNNNCILKALAPASTRKIIDKTLKFQDSANDTIEYIYTLELILNISELLGILFVPSNLNLPGKGKTYKKTMQRCTGSYKKYTQK